MSEVHSEYRDVFRATCKRSVKGNNLTRKLPCGTRITIFKKCYRQDDYVPRYRISIVVPDSDPYYPPGSYETEDEAIDYAIAYLDSMGIDWPRVDMRDLIGDL